MKIIIVGLGKVGYAIAQQMVGEEHDLILVDESAAVIEHADATLDAMCVEGNGACASVLLRAGVRDADLVIAATADDEVNLVCSLMAKKLGAKHTVARVLRSMGRDTSPIRQLSVIGGGRIALYLAWALDGMGMHITIVEQNEEKCMAIAEKLPKATILHGDGTDHDLLESEGIFDADAFVSLTGRDEENLLMALTAKDSGVAKVLPKMSRPNYTALVHDLGIDTVISPKDVTASQISSYVRGLANSQGSAVESLHKILGGAMEAVEFTATGATHFLNTPLKDLNFKPGLLVAAIVHGGKLLIPGGHSIISEGDRVIVVAKSLFLKDLNDILVR